MKVIGLTGGTGCGKSTAAAVLREFGALIVDADAISRRLTAAGGRAIPAIREAFGPDAISPDGSMNRKAMAALVFADAHALQRLNGILHPMIWQALREKIAEAEKIGAPVCVLDVPLLFETGMEALCDRVLCVVVSPQEQLRRVMQRDGLTLEQAKARVASQMPAEEKAARSDDVLSTEGTLEETRELLTRLWESYQV